MRGTVPPSHMDGGVSCVLVLLVCIPFPVKVLADALNATFVPQMLVIRFNHMYLVVHGSHSAQQLHAAVGNAVHISIHLFSIVYHTHPARQQLSSVTGTVSIFVPCNKQTTFDITIGVWTG